MRPPVREISVVFRDAQLLVLNKPAGIATTAPNDGPSLFAIAKQLDPSAPQLHPLSRLDTQVTGLVAFARTSEANKAALQARRHGVLTRRYVGLATQAPEPSSGDWNASIGIDPRDPRHRVALAQGAQGIGVKHALTRYAMSASAGPLVILQLWPRTGRTHQLRVHAAHARAPLAGDTAYGGQKRITLPNGRILTAARVMLHCASLSMPHPSEPGDRLVLNLAPEADMLALWRSAGGAEAALLETHEPTHETHARELTLLPLDPLEEPDEET